MTSVRRALSVVAGLAVLAVLLVVWQREALLHQLRIQGRRGALAWQADSVWYTVSAEHRRRRVWTGVDAFLRDGLEFDELDDGLGLARIRYRRDPNPNVHELVVARVEPELWDFRVVAREDFARVPIQELGQGYSLAVNASFFSDEAPVGLVLQDGEVRVPQGTARAAHFLVDRIRGPRIENVKMTSLEGIEHAVQGFPAVMSDGETFSYMRYGGRGFAVHDLARRTAVCVDRDDAVLIVVTDSLTNGLTLNELATVLGGLGCVDGMGFDGGSSTALVVNAGDEQILVPSRDGIPVVIGLTPKL
ncbi:MAG: phosphodiester glycosidase family protein [Proteobacteria bacterium]|nr:phosphodiester glycosidase family protein [Pseudomonadota bacterium]MCP4920586.1 phosphodiester glycosidase family protein [Pseudomonadota bacterium]